MSARSFLRKLLLRLRPLGWRLWRVVAVTEQVVLGDRVHIGYGSRLWAPHQLVLGDRVYVGKRCTIECDGQIGAGTMIANCVGIIGRNDHDFRSAGVALRDATWVGDRPATSCDVVSIGEDVWIGYGAVVLSGTRIGRGAIVGAGSVVTRDVEPYAVVVGNPARQTGWRFNDREIESHEIMLSNAYPVEPNAEVAAAMIDESLTTGLEG